MFLPPLDKKKPLWKTNSLVEWLNGAPSKELHYHILLWSISIQMATKLVSWFMPDGQKATSRLMESCSSVPEFIPWNTYKGGQNEHRSTHTQKKKQKKTETRGTREFYKDFFRPRIVLTDSKFPLLPQKPCAGHYRGVTDRRRVECEQPGAWIKVPSVLPSIMRTTGPRRPP